MRQRRKRTFRRRRLPVAVGMAVAAFSALPSAASSTSFRGLGVLPGGSSHYSIARDVSADGAVVVGSSRSANGMEAFRWTADTGMVGLGSLNGDYFYSVASGVSANGVAIVGGSLSPLSGERTEAFRWTEATGMVGLGDLPGGEYSGSASAVSEDGSVVAGTSTSVVSPSWGEAFRWTEETGLVGLGDLGEPVTHASVPSGISGTGTIVVGWAFSLNGREAFRWTEPEGMVGMGDLPAGIFDSQARDISADGSVIVGLAHNPGTTSFLWTAVAGMIDLGRPAGGNYSQASGVSADGRVVVGDAGVAGERVPMIWDGIHGMRNLIDVLVELGLGPQIEGWDLEEARAVSADGLTVVGWGYNPDGNEEAWVAYLGQPSLVEIPTSSHGALFLFGTLLAGAALLTLRLR